MGGLCVTTSYGQRFQEAAAVAAEGEAKAREAEAVAAEEEARAREADAVEAENQAKAREAEAIAAENEAKAREADAVSTAEEVTTCADLVECVPVCLFVCVCVWFFFVGGGTFVFIQLLPSPTFHILPHIRALMALSLVFPGSTTSSALELLSQTLPGYF